jgi:GxxExxY protein
MKKESQMIYENETARLRKGFFAVQNEVGLGHCEEIYHKAMILWLEKENILYTSKTPHPLLFDGATAHTLYPDLVVWDKITIELKAVPRRLQDSEHVQIFNYLKRRNDKLGLLVNMGLDRVHIERIIYETPSCEWMEDWIHWNDRMTGANREIGQRVGEVLRQLYKTHGTGYGTEVLGKLIRFGLQKQGLNSISSPVGTSLFQDIVLGKTPFDCLLIENRLLLVFTALFDDNQFNISRGLSFMKCLNVPLGIAANFGKRSVQINGLAQQSIRGAALPSVEIIKEKL